MVAEAELFIYCKTFFIINFIYSCAPSILVILFYFIFLREEKKVEFWFLNEITMK